MTGIRLALTLALLLLANLSQAADPAVQRTLEVGVWFDGATPELTPLLDLTRLFRQQYPQVTVNIHPRPTLSAYRYLERWSGLEAGNAPDLVVINSSWLPQFAPHLASLESLRPAAEKKILKPVLDLLTVNGQLVAVPWGLGARVVLARADLLEAKRLAAPEDWSKLVYVTAPGLHRPPEVWGFGLPGAAGGGGGVLLEEMIWAEGDTLVGEHGGVTLNTPGKVRALERLCELAKYSEPEALSWTQTELESAFGQGRVGMMVSDTWVARSWKSIPQAPAYRVLPLPGGGEPVADLLGDGLAVFATARERDLAVAFAQMLLTSTAQKKLVEWGGLPVHEDLIAAAKEDPLLGPILPTLRAARGGGANTPPTTLRALEYAIYLAVSGRQTPAEALNAAQKALAASLTTAPGGPPG